MTVLIVTPAYGRDYKNKEEAIKDWEAGKDFVAANLTTTYVSKKDLANHPHAFTHVKIRYSNRTRFVFIDLNKPGG